MREMRDAAAAGKAVNALVAKKKEIASSSPMHPRTPPAFPPPAADDTEVNFHLGSLSLRRKRKASEEEAEDK